MPCRTSRKAAGKKRLKCNSGLGHAEASGGRDWKIDGKGRPGHSEFVGRTAAARERGSTGHACRVTIEPMTTSETFRATGQQAGQTLATALRAWLPGKPWSQVRRLLQNRHIMVDGNLCLDAGRRLRGNEVVKILPHPAAPPPREEDVRIRYLDEHLAVVEKPAGMTSVRHAEERQWPQRRKQLQPTLEDLLPRVISKKTKGAKKTKGSPKAARRGLHEARRSKPATVSPVRPVHRLDRETSGLMVFARTVPAERSLGEQFRRHTAYRRYIAVAQGEVPAQTIESRLVRDRGDGRRGSTTQPGIGKRAVTHVTPIERLDGYTLIECRLQTGRTHQIRIHLAEQGHPLCGETIYQRPLFGKPRPDPSGAGRLALHAAELAFDHPITGEHLEFQAPAPRDLAEFIDRLRREARRIPTNRKESP